MKIRPMLEKMVIAILIIVFLLSSYSIAEKQWKQGNGQFTSDAFLIDLPLFLSVVHQQSDDALVLRSAKVDCFLSIILEDMGGMSSVYDVDRLLDVENNTYVASIWTPNQLDAIDSTLVSTSRISKQDIEILEYRFNAIFFGEEWLAYHTFVNKKESSDICEIRFLMKNEDKSLSKSYYSDIIDSIRINESNIKDEGEWICAICGKKNKDNYCSNCGTKRGESSASTPKRTATVKPTSIPEQNSNTNIISKDSTPLPRIKGPYTGKKVNITVKGRKYVLHQDFKKVMDQYQSFFDSYISLFDNLKKSDPDYATKYFDLMQKYIDVSIALENLDSTEELTEDETWYCIYIMNDVNSRLLKAMQN